ncbi:cation channel family protein [Stylonychia lemnae]|uniref:Cation channel family protein n=1 Tax=Stylonychia lemnae TaxID=5949 RepID=A0A078B7F0_STYLE|nr:cation channel family protein [Stylonychia lemnae]|eukprot:CDW89227.1 cation channel family protein [Stylonychia lemnae]
MSQVNNQGGGQQNLRVNGASPKLAKTNILNHQNSLSNSFKNDQFQFQQTASIKAGFIQKQQVPTDNGSKNINWVKQNNKKINSKATQQLKIQLQDLDEEIQKKRPLSRYDTSSLALQKKKNDQLDQLGENNSQSIQIQEEDSPRELQVIQPSKIKAEMTFIQKVKQCCGGKKQKDNSHLIEDYSEGESDTEFETPYSQLNLTEKHDRVKYLWHRSFLKAKGAAHILAKFGELNKKIYLLGAARKDEEYEDQNAVILRTKKCIIMPDEKGKAYWNLVITALLLYTATYVPFRISYVDDNPIYMIILDTIMDMIFLTDLVLSFFSAYEDKKMGVEVRHKYIAIAYIKSWFFLDLMSCVPIQLMEVQYDEAGGQKKQQTSSVKLLRLTRLPRLYRLIRILRLFKMLRLFKQQSSMKRLFDSIKMNAGIVRMISVTITVFFLVHLVGCFWFLSAKLDDFNPDTWVVRFGYLDKDPSVQYLASIYWALQTLTTVGFGDIYAKTIPEKVIAILWMIFGVGFYSFTIGNLSQIIASIDTQSALLSQKLSILSEFSKRTNLPTDVMFRIRRHLENNNKHQNNLEEQEKLLNDLPAALRSEVVKHTHGEIIQKINFFREKTPDFLWAILPALRPIKLMPTDVLYTQGDHSDEKGSYFGDSDIFYQDENKGRDSTAVADTECHLLVLSRKELMQLNDDFEDMSKEMKEIAKERKANHEELIAETVEEHIKTKMQENLKNAIMIGNLRTPKHKDDHHNIFRSQLGSKSRSNSGVRAGKKEEYSSSRTTNNKEANATISNNVFSDAIRKLNVPSQNQSGLSASDNSNPLLMPLTANMNDKIKQREIYVQQGKKELDSKQKKFREDYNETLVNFQNNMNFLAIHADEIQNMFISYQKERQSIMGAMTVMKEQAQQLKAKQGLLFKLIMLFCSSEFLKSTLDMIIEKI